MLRHFLAAEILGYCSPIRGRLAGTEISPYSCIYSLLGHPVHVIDRPHATLSLGCQRPLFNREHRIRRPRDPPLSLLETAHDAHVPFIILFFDFGFLSSVARALSLLEEGRCAR